MSADSPDHFDLTPDPRVLVALTHTPLAPLDALCELVDNAIDSFAGAGDGGAEVGHPLVVIDLPGVAEVNREAGLVRVRDNGPGLTAERAEKAMRAGFSGNNPFDSLGLFGMGFNISTGKLGRVTRLVTARQNDDFALEVTVDLMRLQDSRSYLVPTRRIAKPAHLPHGTVIEVSGWWPAGNANAGFIRKLAGYSKPTVRTELGRRYATILRDRGVRIIVNRDPCDPFEHCVWDRSRSVERQGHGQIPAVFDFDHSLGAQTRCADCFALLRPPSDECGNCGSRSFRTLEQRVRGWVGIQRFDDQTHFGIDLIRNGRAIRVGEQDAFFSYTDDLKRSTKDYPIDSQYGRIVGEVHLNHVPVDFLKQDFQRSSPEWQTAMSFLRGDSSLQPTQPGADQNTSYVYRLYQGYRRVRNPGRRDMYMGYWDTAADKPRRISRDVEEDYYGKFREGLSGYHDDSEWWTLVEQADQRPVEGLKPCPACGADNLESAESCQACDEVLLGKACVHCSETIVQSAVSCPNCGASQIPELRDPWVCAVCDDMNETDAEHCSQCSAPRGALWPASREALDQASDKADTLSLQGCSVILADGSTTQPLDVNVYVTRSPIRPVWQGPEVPLVSFKGQTMDIFLDSTHPLFRSYRTHPHNLIATEVAQFLYDANRRLVAGGGAATHSVSNLMWQIVRDRWGDELEESPAKVREEIGRVFESARGGVADAIGDRGPDLYAELTDDQIRALLSSLVYADEDPNRLQEMVDAGRFVRFVDDITLVELFRLAPDLFFDGGVWDVSYSDLAVPELLREELQGQIASSYLNALEDCASYSSLHHPDESLTHRAAASVDFLERKLIS